MTDHLCRSRSAAIIRTNSIASRSAIPLTRTSSVQHFGAHNGTISHARSYQWPNYYTYTSQYWSNRHYRDYSKYDQYWYDKYRYFSPFYHQSVFPRRYFQTNFLWNESTYWNHYKSYLYDYVSPYGRYNSALYSPFQSPYRYKYPY